MAATPFDPSVDAVAGDAARRLARVALVLAVALIAYGSLYPFAFKGPATAMLGWPRRPTSTDVLINLLLYVPVGALGWLAAGRGVGAALRALAVIGGATLLSGAIEIAQAYDAGRHSSRLDVLMNAAGTCCGIAAALALRHAPFWSRLPDHPGAGSALFLLALWACWRLSPFLVDLSGASVPRAFAPFVAAWRPQPALLFTFALQGLILIHLVAAVSRPGTELARTALVAVVIACLRAWMPGKLVSPQEAYGLAIAAGLWAAGLRQALVVVVLLAAEVVQAGLQPVGMGSPRPFNWLPFRGMIRGASEPAMQFLLWRLFTAGSLAWLLARTGIGYRGAVPVGLGLTLGLEWAQTGVRGRSPDITDPVIYAVMALALARMERIVPRPAPTPPAAVRATAEGVARWPTTASTGTG